MALLQSAPECLDKSFKALPTLYLRGRLRIVGQRRRDRQPEADEEGQGLGRQADVAFQPLDLISLFALTLGLCRPPREFEISVYSIQLLPPDMKRLAYDANGTALMANEPGKQMPPISNVDYAAIESGVRPALCQRLRSDE